MSTIPLVPSVVTAPLGNLFRAAGHLTKAIEISSSCVEASADTIKEISALSLGAKAQQLRFELVQLESE